MKIIALILSFSLFVTCAIAHFDVPYNGADNNDYVDGKGFSERDGSLKGAMLKAASLKDNFQQGDSYEQYQYFYHPDHLGSSSFITNTEGEVVQHIEYVPYGEVFIEERNNVWNTPYLFNAKEFDEETGLYYYGARYYDSRLSMWYGVDALAEKYPNISPYNYCVGNPVMYVDPDGNSTHTTEDGTVVAIYADDDYGIYAHPLSDFDGFDYETKLTNGNRLSNNSEYKRGETWTLYGFADFDAFEANPNYDNIPIAVGAKIDWDSDWADTKINEFINESPSTINYMRNAGNGQKYDFKTQAPTGNRYYGSKMLGKYASARDLGNFAAGIIKASSVLGENIVQWGYGTYNITKDKGKMIGTMLSDMLLMSSRDYYAQQIGIQNFIIHSNGEDTFSQHGIDAGCKYWKTIK